ncbi:hypothetical protein E2C01_034294 [Portunus trituberculatus]|uniref:Uncharacterized protein n=1 Tax=Portunus trituberculatus TaxID=210409 RepID=A0A5B7F686_PORTR|nr:hypothetical protein [Portunus trituberculatus]
MLAHIGSTMGSNPPMSKPSNLHLAVDALSLQLLPVLLSNDVPPPLNTTSCANGNLLQVFVGGAQLGRQVHKDICVISSVMATSDISCKGCEYDYWEIIAPAVPVEDSELNDYREEDVPHPGPSTFH